MGQWAQIPGEFGTVVSAYKRFDVPGEIGSLGAPPGLAYIVISVTAVNTGNGALPLNQSHFLLQDAAGNQWVATVWLFPIELKGSIPAHTSVHGDVYFLVPNLPFSGARVFWELMGDPLKWTQWQLPQL